MATTIFRRDHLLRQDIQRFVCNGELVQLALAHGTDGGNRLEQIVARQRVEDSFGDSAQPMTGTADALQ